MRSIVWSLILLSLTVGWTHSSGAQTPPGPEPARARLDKGAAAPFAGTLLNDVAVAKLITDADAKAKLLQAEVDKLKRDLELEKRSSAAICQAQLEGERLRYAACSKDADRTRELLDKAVATPWYKTPVFNFALGVFLSTSAYVAVSATR